MQLFGSLSILWHWLSLGLEWRLTFSNPDQPRWYIKKQRHYFANKGLSSQGYGFSSSHVWMRELDHKESWALKNFKPWCWRRLLRVPWTAKGSNQSIPKEINPECSSEGLMLRLKLQYFGHLMGRSARGVSWSRSGGPGPGPNARGFVYLIFYFQF